MSKHDSKKKFLQAVYSCLAFAVLALAASMYFGSKDDPKTRTVKLSGNGYICSGVQVKAPSGTDYILSAGHCMDSAIHGSIVVHTEDGKVLERRVIAEDRDSDLLLIEGVPGLPGITVAKTDEPFELIRTLTHGNNFSTYQTTGMLIQDEEIRIPIFQISTEEDAAKCAASSKYDIMEIEEFNIKLCVLDVKETVTSAMIVPGSSGGMAIDSRNELVGICSAGGGGFGYLVRLQDIHSFLAGY